MYSNGLGQKVNRTNPICSPECGDSFTYNLGSNSNVRLRPDHFSPCMLDASQGQILLLNIMCYGEVFFMIDCGRF